MGVPNLVPTDLGALVRDFGEQVTYLPAGGDARTFLAVVRRSEPARYFPTSSGAQVHALNLIIRRSADAAVGIETVTVPGDQVSMLLRAGDTEPTTVRVTRLVSTAPGFFRIQVAR